MTEPLGGMAFPFRIAAGGVARAYGVDKIRQNLHQLLTTRLGELTMRRGYGAGVHQRLQAPNDATLSALVRHEVEQAIRAFVPEVRLTAPVAVAAREELLTVVVEYALVPADVPDRLELRLPDRGPAS